MLGNNGSCQARVPHRAEPWLGAAGCLCQVLGMQGQSERGRLCCTLALVPLGLGMEGRGNEEGGGTGSGANQDI